MMSRKQLARMEVRAHRRFRRVKTLESFLKWQALDSLLEQIDMELLGFVNAHSLCDDRPTGKWH